MENSFDDMRSVTAVFEDAAKAERAVQWLRSIGLHESQIRQAQDPTAAQARPAAPSSPPPKRRKGFMDSLVDFILPDDEAKASANGKPGSGPCLVTVSNIPSAMFDKVVSILNDEGKVKLDAPTPAVTEAPKANVAEPSTISIAGASSIKGFIGACLVDSDSGMMLASEGGDGRLDLDLVAALNSDSVRTGQHVVDQLGLDEKIEEILINLNKQVHLIRPLEQNRSMFVYVALEKASSNLGMARIQLKNIEANVKL